MNNGKHYNLLTTLHFRGWRCIANLSVYCEALVHSSVVDKKLRKDILT